MRNTIVNVDWQNLKYIDVVKYTSFILFILTNTMVKIYYNISIGMIPMTF